jgi:hypothetical protein
VTSTNTPLSHNHVANAAFQFAVLAEPAASQRPLFITDRVSYSSEWSGPSGTTHVLVDGLINGWLGSKPFGLSRPHYALAGVVTGVEVATVAGVGGFVCLVVGDAIRRHYRRTVMGQRRSRH